MKSLKHLLSKVKSGKMDKKTAKDLEKLVTRGDGFVVITKSKKNGYTRFDANRVDDRGVEIVPHMRDFRPGKIKGMMRYKPEHAMTDINWKDVKDMYMENTMKESEPKFRSVHTKSTFDSTFGGWYSEHVPLTTKFMQSILGKERVSVFHIGSADLAKDILGVGRIVGKSGTLSTFTKVDKGEKLAKGRGIQSGGGIIYQLEGSLLVASTRDMQTHPDKTGRRWVEPMYLAGKVAGSKMQRELEKGIETNKIDQNAWDEIQNKAEKKWEKEVDYWGDYEGGWRGKEEAMKEIMGPLKRKWIKKYIDMCYKIMRKYKPQIKRHILSQKDKPSEHGWNEILVNQIKIKDVFLLSREGKYKSIRDAAEKVATGTVTVGTPGKFRKWYEERGGVINEGKTMTMNEKRGTCWVGYQQIGMKKKNGRMVPNCVKEDVELYYEENGKGYGYTFEFITDKSLQEAEYQGRKVKLNKIMQGDAKKFKVYVKNPKGNVVKVNFGQGGKAKGGTMRIRKSNPKARANFRARHNCDNPGPKHKARYWACRTW